MLIKSSQWQTLSPILHSFWKESEKNNMDPLDGDKWLREAVIEPKREKWWTPKIIDEDCRTFKLIGRHFFLIKNKADRRNKRFIKISIARYINIITKHTTQITTINGGRLQVPRRRKGGLLQEMRKASSENFKEGNWGPLPRGLSCILNNREMDVWSWWRRAVQGAGQSKGKKQEREGS